jgi:DNA-binding NtrC family response regulator
MANDKPRILLIDDGETYARVVSEQMPEFSLVQPTGGKGPGRIADGRSALAYLKKNHKQIDLVLLDMHFDLPEEMLLPLDKDASPRRTRRYQGVAILREIRRRFPHLPVVLLTAVEDLSLVDVQGELASQSMTYLLDGEDLDSLRIRINSALSESTLSLEESGILWGGDPAMRAVKRRLAVLARGRVPVILEGETGTGKSYLAERFLHRNSGRKGPFVTVDLSTVSRDLIPAYLFGALRGAYTGAVADRKGAFETADGGTLLIDEVQNVPLEVQKQLLFVLQEGRVRPLGSTREVKVDVKVIAATNQPLAEAVAAGRFRADLYMRLSPARSVTIPPLRERPDDLRFLASRFVDLAVADRDLAGLRDQVAMAVGQAAGSPLQLTVGRPGKEEPPGGLQLVLPNPGWKQLLAHSWPGNVRELSMVMYNLAAFTLVGAVDALHAGLTLRSSRLQVDPGLLGQLLAGTLVLGGQDPAAGERRSGAEELVAVRVEPGESLNGVANEVERQYLTHLFHQTGGDFAQMAVRLLGDAGRTRAVRLRFNQLGLKVRELRAR